MLKIHENQFGEDIEITYSKILSCAAVTLELNPPKFIGMHFVFVDTNLIPGIVELVNKQRNNRKIKKLYLALVSSSWQNHMKHIDGLKTSFPNADEYLIKDLDGNNNKLRFKFENDSVVITDKDTNITNEFEEWYW